MLFALKEKAEKEGILGDTSKIKNIYEAIGPYMGTDLGLQEMITLGKIGSQIKKENIATFSIHDDPTICGGLLYTPARDLYNGASVLVAATKDNKDIHNFTEAQFNYPELHRNGIKIQVLNGTKAPGLAGETKILFNRLCLKVIRFGNGASKDVQTTTYFLKKEIPAGAITALQSMIPGITSTVIPPKYLESQYLSDADIIIELGEDYLPRKMKDPYDYIVDLFPKPVSGEATPATIIPPPSKKP